MKKEIFVYILLGVVVAVSAWFVFVGNPSDSRDKMNTENEEAVVEEKSIDIIIEEKRVVSGNATISVTHGDVVTLRVMADDEEEFHLHGYDKSVDLVPGEYVELSFHASATGRFVFELEESKVEIGAVEVRP